MRTLTLTDEQAAQLAGLLNEVADEREDYAWDMSRENEPEAAAENAANADLCRAVLVLLANQPAQGEPAMTPDALAHLTNEPGLTLTLTMSTATALRVLAEQAEGFASEGDTEQAADRLLAGFDRVLAEAGLVPADPDIGFFRESLGLFLRESH